MEQERDKLVAKSAVLLRLIASTVMDMQDKQVAFRDYISLYKELYEEQTCIQVHSSHPLYSYCRQNVMTDSSICIDPRRASMGEAPYKIKLSG